MVAKPKAQVDFSKYMDVSMDDVPEFIASLPGGHYYATITGWKNDVAYYQGKDNPGTPVVVLLFRFEEPTEDVEPDELNGVGVQGKTGTKNYSLNDPDKAGHTMVRQLAERACDIDVKGLAFPDVLDALKNQRVRVLNEPRQNPNDPEQTFIKITRVLPEHEDA